MKRVILVGLSGSGKSSVARELAADLGFQCIDIDEEIVTSFGHSIPEIFGRYGEPVFRTMERERLAIACAGDRKVIATGGGAIVDEQNWVLMRPESLIIHLEASIDDLLARLSAQQTKEPDSARPLVGGSDPRSALERLREARQSFYRRADVTVDTTGKDLSTVVTEVLTAVRAAEHGDVPLSIASIGVPGGRSDLYVAAGLLSYAGRLVAQRFPDARRSWVITDTNVGPLWSERVRKGLASTGLDTRVVTVPAGESSKSMGEVARLLDEMLGNRLERHDIVIALGGGVIGDLAGFVASIALRGLGLVQIPTSLLAMVDSSVGGKTGVNHARGKNLIGAFYQPQLVLADPSILTTLPEREWRGGWAEIAKHAMIERTATRSQDPLLLETIEAASDSDLRDPRFMSDIVRRNVLIKSAVVRQDEREAGQRRILNYGHTLGHAMEASGYRYHHGEAVALGMRAAAAIGVTIGQSDPDVERRQNAMIDRLGLPSSFEGDLSDVVEHLWSDKKAVHGRLTWVLPARRAGCVDVVTNVPLEVVESAATALGARR